MENSDLPPSSKHDPELENIVLKSETLILGWFKTTAPVLQR